MSKRVGLARVLSKRGFCSRSQAFTLVRAGRVRVNGVVRRDGESPVDPERDRIEVDGSPVAASGKIYWMLNKPRGVVTTTSDEKGRETVYAHLPELSFVAPVGRLDKASEGLLLFTNDSEWAARITAPKTHLAKTYHVQAGTVADAKLVERLRRGVRSDGELLSIRECRVLRTGEKNSWLEIILDEGKNRHIRRMFEAMNIEVLRLMRVAIGPLKLGELAKGCARELRASEKQAIDLAMRGQHERN